jgi:hypothetical protein
MADDQTPDAPVEDAPTNPLDQLVVRIANETSLLDAGVLLCAELGDRMSATSGDPEKVQALVNALNIHQHHLAYALTVSNVDEMPAGELPADEVRKRDIAAATDGVETAVVEKRKK